MRRWLLALGLLLVSSVPGAARAEPSFTLPREEVTLDVADVPAIPDTWVSIPGIAFTVHGAPEDDDLLRSLSAHGDEALPRLADALDLPIGGEIHVFLAEDEARFRALQPGHPPVWADATAYPSAGTIFLRHPDVRGGVARPLEQVLDHELVHLVLGRAFGDVPVPRWLQEGVAQVYSGEHGPNQASRLARGLRLTDTFSLSDLERGFPEDAARAELAYALSADFVAWLRGTYGDDAVGRLVRAARTGRSLDAAMPEVTGLSLAEVDAKWSARFAGASALSWLPSIPTEDLLFGIGGLAFLAVGATRFRGQRRRMAAVRRDELALDRLAREVLSRRGGDAPRVMHG